MRSQDNHDGKMSSNELLLHVQAKALETLQRQEEEEKQRKLQEDQRREEERQAELQRIADNKRRGEEALEAMRQQKLRCSQWLVTLCSSCCSEEQGSCL